MDRKVCLYNVHIPHLPSDRPSCSILSTFLITIRVGKVLVIAEVQVVVVSNQLTGPS